MNEATLGRFWEKVEVKDKDNCWEWTASLDGKGYGQFSINRRNERSHRVSWEIYNGEIPKGMLICHKCDNRKCVNPHHLFMGTQLMNVQDMDRKGRRISVIRIGENHSMAKLTKKQVRVIKHLLHFTSMQQTKIAKFFNIGIGTINHIKKGRQWNSVKLKSVIWPCRISTKAALNGSSLLRC